jgi:hypothetical protein
MVETCVGRRIGLSVEGGGLKGTTCGRSGEASGEDGSSTIEEGMASSSFWHFGRFVDAEAVEFDGQSQECTRSSRVSTVAGRSATFCRHHKLGNFVNITI